MALPNIKAKYEPRTTYLTVQEAERVWRHLRAQTRERAAQFCWFLGTGARLGEAQRAHEDHVHATEIHIPGTKTAKAASTIPITEVTKPWIVRALKDAPRTADGLLFAHWHNVYRDLRKACAAVNAPRVSPNDLRRTMITWHYERGTPPHLLAELARHASTEMVQRVYAQKSSRATGEILAKYVPLATVKPPSRARARGRKKSA